MVNESCMIITLKNTMILDLGSHIHKSFVIPNINQNVLYFESGASSPIEFYFEGFDRMS